MRRATWLSDKPDFSNANARRRRSDSRSALPFGLGTGTLLLYHYCIIYAAVNNRHTLVTELAESGAGDEVIMSIAGHVSRAMLSRYSHVRMEAKRRALDGIAARQCAADDKRREQAAVVSQSAVVQ